MKSFSAAILLLGLVVVLYPGIMPIDPIDSLEESLPSFRSGFHADVSSSVSAKTFQRVPTAPLAFGMGNRSNSNS